MRRDPPKRFPAHEDFDPAARPATRRLRHDAFGPIEVGATPTCTSDAECTAKWAAARTYVLQHAGMKIQNYAPDYLETFGSSDMSIAAQVNKAPLPQGGYAITAKFWCGNMFGCMENPRALLAGFNREASAINLGTAAR